MQEKNRILVISEGPPPLGDTFAEGGALRAWGLAKGLALHGWRVTFVYRSSFDIGNFDKNEIPKNVDVSVWNGELLDDLLHNHEIIILRYAMGEAAEIVKRLNENHILISDSYIPISVEVSARNSSDPNEQLNYLRLQSSSAYTMLRADYILYASPAQKIYYLGYLSGINKLNPTTYRSLDGRLFEVPYGVDPSGKPASLRKSNGETLLWYGAFYSWFDMESLVPALKKIANKNKNFKFLIAGAKNPYNQDLGLLAHYKKTMEALKPLGSVVEHIDWHPYKDRFSVYEKADAIITLNHLGLENELAWRTRLMDYILADKPILTNGGDPLGEDLIERGIAFKFDTDSLETVFQKVVSHRINKEIFDAATERYSWRNITQSLSDELRTATRLNNGATHLSHDITRALVRKVAKKTINIPRYVKKHGLRKAVKHIKNKI